MGINDIRKICLGKFLIDQECYDVLLSMKDIIQLYNSSKREQVLKATIYSFVAEGMGFMGGISPNN